MTSELYDPFTYLSIALLVAVYCGLYTLSKDKLFSFCVMLWIGTQAFALATLVADFLTGPFGGAIVFFGS